MADQLQARWLRFWQDLGARGNPEPVFQELHQRYVEPARAYHNLTHIADCFAEFDQSMHLARDPHAIEMAIWFHDAIYDPRAKDNEALSAELARNATNAAGLPQTFAAKVTLLILATKHNAPPRDPDAALVVDIDLSILGQPAARFDAYEDQIHQEYSWVPQPAFVEGRTRILKSFLDRSSIYSTELFKSRYEAAARSNLSRSVARLAPPI